MTKDEALKMRIEQDEQWSKIINRKWQGLTDDEKSNAYNKFYNEYESDDVGIGDFMLIYSAIEQALKDKNT